MYPRREAEREGYLRTVEKSQIVIAPHADVKKHDQEGGGIEFMIQARSLADRGELEEALSVCRRYLEKDHPCAELYYLMGLIHESRDRVGEAEECYLKALYLEPDHFETLIHAGLMYERRHDHEKATLFRNRVTRIERQRHDNGN
jgi:chemotaxis protein methyltransferase WspC